MHSLLILSFSQLQVRLILEDTAHLEEACEEDVHVCHLVCEGAGRGAAAALHQLMALRPLGRVAAFSHLQEGQATTFNTKTVITHKSTSIRVKGML